MNMSIKSHLDAMSHGNVRQRLRHHSEDATNDAVDTVYIAKFSITDKQLYATVQI